MRLLITGGAGFIGSHLAEARLAAGDEVTVVDDLSTGSRENIRLMEHREGFRFVLDSVRNETTMTALVDRCDAVIHLAAAVGVQLIADDPVRTIETNIHGSEVVLSLANRFRRRVLVASTSEVYGKSGRTPFREDDDVVFGSTRFSRWCYGCSKMVDEFLALAYHEQFGLETIVCRFFNIVGPRQTGKYGMVVPRFVRRALRDEPLEICGDGSQVRCFCSVLDLVTMLGELLDCPEAVGRVVNVGSDEPVSIDQLADRVIKLTDSRSEKVYVDYEDFYGRSMEDTAVRIPELSRLRDMVPARRQFDLTATLQQVIEYEKIRL
ncbi:MAG: NAD-dependent epimerase/dehydratase family protein [Phycisphaerae bacterium]